MYSARSTLMHGLLGALALSALLASPAQAEVYVNGTIHLLRTGWNADSFGLEINAPQQNPAGCPTPNGYVIDSTQPGYKTIYLAAIAAYEASKPVSVVVDSN